jgi:hypothetical protein
MKKSVVAIFVLVGLVVAIVFTSRETRSPRPSALGLARLRFLASQSYCQERPGDGGLLVRATFWNLGSLAARVSILPIWNDSLMARSSGTVPAHSLRHLWAKFGDDGLKRDLLECSVQIDAGRGLGRPVALSIAPPD